MLPLNSSMVFRCQKRGCSVYVSWMGAYLSLQIKTWRYLFFAVIASFLMFYPHRLLAQEESGPLVLEHADKLESSGGGGDIVNLIGNVHFKHDKADLYSQRATWYRASGLVQFVDSVLVVEEGRRINAQTMTYYRRDRKITALHHVAIIDSIQNVELFCDRADYFRDTKQLDASGYPKLTLNASDDSSKMVIDALKLTYFGADAHGTAYDSVQIIKRDMVAHAGQADFYRNPEKAVLIKKPVIINGQNLLSGDTISIFTENRRLNRLLVRGNAQGIYKTLPDTSINEYTTAEIAGRELEAFFANDKIQQMITRYNATSLYAPAITDTVVHGTNIASGDSITLFFSESTIKRVFISGGAQGEFIEPKFGSDGKGYFDTTKYSADEIDYSFDKSQINLNRNGSMHYHEMALTSGVIQYDTKTRILIAEGLGTDSTGGANQSPVLKQGTEELAGQKMSYNIDTKKGQVRMARTKYDGGFYTGQALRQVSKDVLLVSQANYTSCDKDPDPHYHFHSNKMKMINKNKVIAKPVFLYIGELPVFAIPFYVFPVRKGRHSGFLPFELGNLQSGNRFIRNLGYYWAASDYYDLQGSLDFTENTSTIIKGTLQYALQYRGMIEKLNGTVSVNYARERSWDTSRFVQNRRNRYMISFSHNQTMNNGITLGGSGTFISDKNYISQNVYNPAERLNRTVSSDFSLSKGWPAHSISLVIAARQDWNLDTDEKTELLPSFSIYRTRLPLFADPSKTKKKIRVRPDEQIEEPKKRFYHSIYFDISSSGQNLRQRFRKADSTFYRMDYQTINTKSSLSSPQKFLGFLNITPGINATHSLVRLSPSPKADSLGLVTGKFVERILYGFSVGANTSVYGTVYPNKFGLLGIRHVMTPSVSYSFTPSIRKNQSYFKYVGSGIGSTRSKSMVYSLTNLFQAKYKSGESEKKIDLFNLTFSGSYNFAVDSLQFSPLSTTLRTSAIPKLDISFNSTHSFYDLNSAHRRPILQPRLTYVSISTSIKGGYHPGGGEKNKGEEKDVSQRAFGPKATGPSEPTSLGIDFDLSHNYSESRGAGKPQKTQWINLSTQIQPTLNWRVEYDCRYNLVNKRIESQSFNIGRDLHCWQFTFTWIPSGAIAGYYARISIKTLPDIKFESSRGGLRGPYNY
jgi:lipopolysaccharide assembly outer membrane protein LptD (OstA)